MHRQSPIFLLLTRNSGGFEDKKRLVLELFEVFKLGFKATKAGFYHS